MEKLASTAFNMPADVFSILRRRQPSTAGATMRTRPTHNRQMLTGAGILLLAAACSLLTPAPTVSAETGSPTVLSEMIAKQAEDFPTLESNADAMALFISKTGPSLGLKDASGILGAKGLSAQMIKELDVESVTQSVHSLMAALTVWHMAESIYRIPSAPSPTAPTPAIPSSAQQEWMKSASHVPGLDHFLRLLSEQTSSSPSLHTELLRAAHQLAVEAHDLALTSWWSLSDWKDRIRQTRGRARLCGTWQWTLHNHQNHREQKMAMLFPPPGVVGADIPLPAETIILGDSIYLRWERNGYVQEDSLLFIQEGHKQDRSKATLRIEGSFVNNTGGWGSIVGKRTADCQS